MAQDIRVKDAGSANALQTAEFITESGTSDIKAGDPVKLKSAGSQYVVALADAEPVAGTTTAVAGIAAADSVHTGSADGKLPVYVPNEGVIYEVKAKDTANVDSESKIEALLNKKVLLDLTSDVFTVDTATVAADNNGVIIRGAEKDTGLVRFSLNSAVTLNA